MDVEKKYCYLDEFKIVKTLGAGYHATYFMLYSEWNWDRMIMGTCMQLSVTRKKPPTLLPSSTNWAL